MGQGWCVSVGVGGSGFDQSARTPSRMQHFDPPVLSTQTPITMTLQRKTKPNNKVNRFVCFGLRWARPILRRPAKDRVASPDPRSWATTQKVFAVCCVDLLQGERPLFGSRESHWIETMAVARLWPTTIRGFGHTRPPAAAIGAQSAAPSMPFKALAATTTASKRGPLVNNDKSSQEQRQLGPSQRAPMWELMGTLGPGKRTKAVVARLQSSGGARWWLVLGYLATWYSDMVGVCVQPRTSHPPQSAAVILARSID